MPCPALGAHSGKFWPQVGVLRTRIPSQTPDTAMVVGQEDNPEPSIEEDNSKRHATE